MQVGGCSICGGAHESGCCIPQDDVAKEANYMGNQNKQGFHSGGFQVTNKEETSIKIKGKDGGHI